MTTYYVRVTGSNSNNGLSAGAAFLTLAKAATVVAAGDLVHVGAGTYRETISLSTSGTAGNAIQWVADYDGLYTGDAGDVVHTSFTTNDTTASSSSAPLNLNGKGY